MISTNTLTDDIAKAEQRAREKVEDAADTCTCGRGMHLEWCEFGKEMPAALTRYAAVCRLAGRWTQHLKESHHAIAVDHYQPCPTKAAIRTELAKLMEGCP